MKSEEKIVLGLVVVGFLWQTGATTKIIEITKTIYKEVVKILKKAKELAEKIINWNWKAILTALATSFVMWKSFPLFLRTAALIGGGFPVALMLAVAVGVTSSIAVGTAVGLKFQEDVEAENNETKEQIEKGQGTTNNSLPTNLKPKDEADAFTVVSQAFDRYGKPVEGILAYEAEKITQ